MDKFELGILNLTLQPERDCCFRSFTGRLVQAALLRRIELVNPGLSAELHNTPVEASSTEKPWTISGLIENRNFPEWSSEFFQNKRYFARVAGLTAPVVFSLQAAFDPEHPLGREPLIIGQTAFNIVFEEIKWERLATYASLLTRSRPYSEFLLRFESATGFRTAEETTALPDPFHCIQGYLRRWNAFSTLGMQSDPLLDYVKKHLKIKQSDLLPARLNFRSHYETGWTGATRWASDEEDSFLLRMVNALIDYSIFCGTGKKTTMGMGQTRRMKIINKNLPTASLL